MADLKEFDSLLESTIKAPRLSGTKVARLSALTETLVHEDGHIVKALCKLNGELPPATQARISSLYVLDAIARAARAAVNKGVGRELRTEAGKGTQAGLLRKLEGVVAGWVDGIVDDGRGGVWSEGKDKTRKIIDIWQKHGTFPQACLDGLKAKIASATSREGSSSSSSRKLDQKSSDRKLKGKTGPGSTTPPYPPPASMLAGADSVPAPPPVQPGLPPEIAKMLGIKEKPKSAGADGGTPPLGSGGQPLDIAALLASVTQAQSSSDPSNSANLNPAPSSISAPVPPTTFTYPLPGQPTQFNSTNLPPGQAHLTALAALSGKGPTIHPTSSPYPPSGQAFPYTPSRDVFNRNVKDHDITNSLSGGRRGSPAGSGPGAGLEIDARSPGRQRAEGGDARRGRSRSPDGKRKKKEYEDGKHEHGRLGPPQHAPRGNGQAPGGLGLPAVPISTGADSEPFNQHQATERQATLTQHALRDHNLAGTANGQQPTLATFDLSSFNPTLVECWAGLALAWRRTTGREPGQVELMHWLTTGQVMGDGTAGGGDGEGGARGGVQRQGQGHGQGQQGQQPQQQQPQSQQLQQPNSQPTSNHPGPPTRGNMPNVPYPSNYMGPPPVPQHVKAHSGHVQAGNPCSNPNPTSNPKPMGLSKGLPPIPPLSAGMPPPIVKGGGHSHGGDGMGMMGMMSVGMLGQGMGGGVNSGMTGMNQGMMGQGTNSGMNQDMGQMGQMCQMGGGMNPMVMDPSMVGMNMNMNNMGMGMGMGAGMNGGQQWPGMSAGQWGGGRAEIRGGMGMWGVRGVMGVILGDVVVG